MGYPETFEGFRSQSHQDWTTFKKESYKPKAWEDRDIDIAIDACGVCGSDVHTITGGWGDSPMPLCVGHEIIGKVVKVGDKSKLGFKVGDRVGVGAQVASCLECEQCLSDNENYCPNMVDTYGAPWPVDGTIGQGGMASHIRVHEYFTFKIPDSISDHEAAPMLCAGITTFSPLYRAKITAGKKVAVVGLGGLGHFGVLWAKAMGAEVTVLSHSPNKKDDALKLGADHFVSTGEDEWSKPLKFKFDFILNTADMTHEMKIGDYMSTLRVNGTLHHVGLPDHPIQLMVQDMVPSGGHMGASHIGSRPEMIAMLKLAADKSIHPMIETVPISEQGCKEVVERVKNNKIRYRFTLTDFDKAFGSRS